VNRLAKHRRVLILCGIGLSLALGFIVFGQLLGPLFMDQYAKQEGVETAALLDLFSKSSAGWRDGTFCVSIDGKNPSELFLRRFENHEPRVVRGSACHPLIVGPVTEDRTGRHALIFRISKVYWVDHSQAELEWEADCGLKCGEGGTYRVGWKRGRWVAECHSSWVS